MKLVPEAHDALLRLIEAQSLDRLPQPRFDMQTPNLLPVGLDAADTRVKKLISVFLTPDENVDSFRGINESDRAARYDGVIQYGSKLVVVIENKLISGVSHKQAQDINPKGARWKTATPLHVKWHELLNRWWDISESPGIETTKAEIIREFFDYAETYFGDLLPFTDLGRCKDNTQRRLRRLCSLMQEATGLPGAIYSEATDPATGQTYQPGVTVKLPEFQITAADRVNMWIEKDSVRLVMFLGEVSRQYKYLYPHRDRVESLVSLTQQPHWDLVANFHIGYRFSRAYQRWYPARHLSGIDYVRQWSDDVKQHAGQRSRAQIQSKSFRDWLTKQRYADKSDLDRLRRWIETKSPGIKFHTRPSVQIVRSWDLKQAVKLDQGGRFSLQIEQALNQILAALDEPTVDELRTLNTPPSPGSPRPTREGLHR